MVTRLSVLVCDEPGRNEVREHEGKSNKAQFQFETTPLVMWFWSHDSKLQCDPSRRLKWFALQ